MKDRVPTYAGRVRLTPVTGQTNIYDLERADEPTEAGTPLSKANLLTDATATAMGLSEANATVNNALAATWAKAVAAKTAADVFAGGLYVEAIEYEGTSGSSKSLEFSAPPTRVIIFDISGASYAPLALITPSGGVVFLTNASNGNARLSASRSGNILTWEATTGGASAAMNTPGTTYYGLAFLDKEAES